MRFATTLLGSTASPFANFRRKPAKAAKAEDEKDDDKKESKAEDEKDEDPDSSKAEDDDKKESKAEDDDGEEDDDKDDKKSKKSKKSKKAEDDDEKCEDDDDGDEPEARVRAKERARIRAIIESEPGQANVEAAYELAVNSDMAVANAIAILRSVGPKAQGPSGNSLRERMSQTPQPDIGAGGGEGPSPGDPKAVAAAIVAAGKKRRGETV